MDHPAAPVQSPAPGVRLLRFQGDVETVTLTLPAPAAGGAWLRTNLGRAAEARREIVAEIEQGLPRLARDWFDLPMRRVDERTFAIRLPLLEVGHFEAKAYFLPEGSPDPVWPPGDNTAVNIEPADTCCANIIYNAFVRQFGPNKAPGGFPDPSRDERVQALDRAGYTVIPPSGTFRDLIAELDFIVDTLGCTVLQLLPIHPTPTIYARMGRFGSPYAALSFTAVDPALAAFDPAATPLEQFIELVDEIHARQAKILIDVAINHTGWAAGLHETHPGWLVRDSDGRIQAPGAWGVTWADLTRLDYSQKDLWTYMAGVFLTWCRRGVDGFRCDAGYMIPVPAWTYIIAAVREQFPDTIFLLEGLGGLMTVTRRLLNQAGFNWAYSELFQNYDRGQIEHYLPEALAISGQEGVLVHFAETHDNNRLAARSIPWARMRTALCALSSVNGGFAFANGVEWLATEKINVHEAASLNWGATPNQVAAIGRLTRLLKNHPAFHDRVDITFRQGGEGDVIVLLRRHRPSGRRLLIVVNLDDTQARTAAWHAAEHPPEKATLYDLVSGETLHPPVDGGIRRLPLPPGGVHCLSEDPDDLELPGSPRAETGTGRTPRRILDQRLLAKALAVHQAFNGTGDLGEVDPPKMASELEQDPVAFCRGANPLDAAPRVITWQHPRDLRREVMVPPGHCLLLRADAPFRARLMSAKRCLAAEKSLPARDGSHFVLFTPLPPPEAHLAIRLALRLLEPGKSVHCRAPLLYLAPAEKCRAQLVFTKEAVRAGNLLFLGTDGRGAMLRARAEWAALGSRYDSLLAANLHPDIPVNRHIMLTRCRVWLVFQGYSQAISIDCLEEFGCNGASAWWRFRIPAGQGQSVGLTLSAAMAPGENRATLHFHRHAAGAAADSLADDRIVRLVIRPDIEDRGFHELTKAYLGPEHAWPAAFTYQAQGFTFAPAPDRRLSVRTRGARFVPEPEWHYMVHRPLEAQRGEDPDSDLFSPGWFDLPLAGNTTAVLEAAVNAGDRSASPPAPPAFDRHAASRDPLDALAQAMMQYVVRRGRRKSVIAGYPWFLDWGRDALIFCRGMIAAGMLAEARSVIAQFARFEKDGTLPNMIVGEDAGNRDTADAPLWLMAACRDLIAAEGDDRFLESRCGGRSMRRILVSIGRRLLGGTPNGLGCDAASGLLYSPSHFTWMDTDHPAGTPRAGYPIEIQALWHAALCLLAEIDDPAGKKQWRLAADQARRSIRRLYPLKRHGYLADCLHAQPGTPAARAEADDALRPNQLFAITMGAVDDPALARGVLAACEALLVPGAIRSLADQPVRRPLEIRHHGQLLNDPLHPYQGTYAGDEDTRRKPAYHNGTAWTWVFPSYCEAWAAVYGPTAHGTALAWLSSMVPLLNSGCVGHVPEILDGDAPHHQRGCDAQAWGASEALRVWARLRAPSNSAGV